MLEFRKLAGGFYALYLKGERVAAPLTKSELHQAVLNIELSEGDMKFINSGFFEKR